jgi:alkylation response protein AidB-like acyl-CoA dehydrogenase
MKLTERSGLLESVQSLTPKIRAACDGLDSQRALPHDVVAMLREVGAFRALAPRVYGGGELDPVTFVRLTEEAAYADGSVGWCLMIGGGLAGFGGLLPSEGAAEVLAAPDSIIAGTFRPAGTARRVRGGYQVSGRWPFASGSSHAGWFLAGCIVTNGDQPENEGGRPTGRFREPATAGTPVIREVLVPASEVEVIDTWDSTGLRGTASHDFSIKDVFVPERRSFWFAERPVCDGPLYRMPAIGTFAAYIAAVPLGVARHALDEFLGLAAAKKPTWSSAVLADNSVIHDVVGRADVTLAAGRSFLLSTLEDVWGKVEAGASPTATEHGALWLASTHAANNALAVVESLYTAAGATSVYAACPLDRCLRDVRTAVQHVVLQVSNFEQHGRLLLNRGGAPPPWVLLDLRNS